MQQLVLVSGSTGTGKSTLANAIASDLSCAVGSFDWLMSALRSMPEVWAVVELPVERQRELGWRLLGRLAEQELRHGRSLVLDLVARETPRQAFRTLAERYGAAFTVVECVCSDIDLLQRRVVDRRRDIPDWYELSWADIQRSRENYAPLADPKTLVDAVNPLSENLDKVRDATRVTTASARLAIHTNDPQVMLSDDVVTLRPWSRSDAEFIADASADPAIQRYSVPHDRRGYPAPPASKMDAETVIDEFEANWQAFSKTGRPSGVAFAITDASSGEVAGMCGVDEWSKEDVAQIGYWLAPRARGRGYASRAVTLLTGWLFELGAARVFLTIVAGNDASVEVARRAGFVYEGTMRDLGVWQGQRCDVTVFAALPREWTERTSTH